MHFHAASSILYLFTGNKQADSQITPCSKLTSLETEGAEKTGMHFPDSTVQDADAFESRPENRINNIFINT